MSKKEDAVDHIMNQWRRERPDLDPSPMGLIGRLARCEMLLRRKLDETFERFGMTSWEFDVLATLRRAGHPYSLAPTALYSSLMVTSGTMTHRLQRLEKVGLVERVQSNEDLRSMLVQLTDAGLNLINQAVEAHIANEQAILDLLPAESRKQLDKHLVMLLSVLDVGIDRPTT
ncbi:MarR family winged helix-turn-helix transcriptional regulator [Methylophilus sp. QUAN]|uniref:MarR family winged helix-turn-helix transcriptional regulator n=1 Tax=Methylophilus sp. QUAN TaxID=2781020 RepID=UPI0018903D3D|nr:MarR family transcriptional regulator [Methylophilus sp. QUAN]MBF4990637.1 MarR family transcriptional regulator [Methylophilus sp. QUAN]